MNFESLRQKNYPCG